MFLGGVGCCRVEREARGENHTDPFTPHTHSTGRFGAGAWSGALLSPCARLFPWPSDACLAPTRPLKRHSGTYAFSLAHQHFSSPTHPIHTHGTGRCRAVARSGTLLSPCARVLPQATTRLAAATTPPFLNTPNCSAMEMEIDDDLVALRTALEQMPDVPVPL